MESRSRNGPGPEQLCSCFINSAVVLMSKGEYNINVSLTTLDQQPPLVQAEDVDRNTCTSSVRPLTPADQIRSAAAASSAHEFLSILGTKEKLDSGLGIC